MTKPAARLGRLERPLYGQVALWVVLAVAVYSLRQVARAYEVEVHPAGQGVHVYPFGIPLESEPERHRWISLLSFLPFRVLHSPAVFWTCVVGFHVSAALWAFRRLCRLSAAATASFYTASLSLFWEHGAAVAEWWNPVAVSLVVFAGWYALYGREIREASRSGEFWRRRLFPVWVRELAVFNVAWFFFLTGAGKLLVSGPGWTSGTNLQLAVHRFRIEWHRPLNALHGMVLSDRDTATAMATAVLVVECGAILAVVPTFAPRLWPVRFAVGILLSGFLVGVFFLFGTWYFESLLVLVIVFLFPFDRLASTLVQD